MHSKTGSYTVQGNITLLVLNLPKIEERDKYKKDYLLYKYIYKKSEQ